jgi:ADP-ribose pyrophosphatase YjhB (NUDIX family)
MLSKEDYLSIMKNAPIPCIDLALEMPGGYVFIKRDNHPYRGCWAFPGGRIFKYEAIDETINRVSREEVGVNTENKRKDLIGIYSVVNSMAPYLIRHDITSFFHINVKNQRIKTDKFAKEYKISRELPRPTGELYEWEYKDLKR